MRAPIVLSRVKVTPDPDAAAALERKQSALSYQPANGFLRDKQQQRVDASASFIDRLLSRVPSLLRRQAS